MWEIIVGVVILLVIIIGVMVWYLYPRYSNNVLNTVYWYNSWTDGTTPYTFLILANNQLQLAYYDTAGYLRGFTTLIFNYTMPNANTLLLSLASTTVDYSKVARTYPWTLTYTGAKQLILEDNIANVSATRILSIF